MKRILLCIALTMNLMAAAAQTFVEAGGLRYRVLGDGRSVELTNAGLAWPYYGEVKPQGRVVVPAEVGGYAVVGVGANAFYRCDGLEEVVLPEGCTYIGPQAFCGCTALRSATFGPKLGRVDEGAFAYCRSLAKVELPPSVVKVGLSAFAMCTSLSEVSMGEAARSTCNHLTFLGTPYAERAKNAKNTGK